MPIKINLKTLGISLLLSVSVSQKVLAVPTASPADNETLIGVLDFFTGASLSSMIIGLAPYYPIAAPAQVASFGSDLTLRNTPARFNPPSNKTVYPNITEADNGGFCQFDLEMVAESALDARTGKMVFQADQDRFYNFKTDQFSFDPEQPAVFGNLGEPVVYHPHARVRVRVDSPAVLDSGHHDIGWKAETRLNVVLDIALPAVLITTIKSSEVKFMKQNMSKQISKELAKFTKAGLKATRVELIKNAKASLRSQFFRQKIAKRLLVIMSKFLPSKLEGAESFNIDLNLIGLPEYELDLDGYRAFMELDRITTAVNQATQQVTVYDQHPPYFRDPDSQSIITEQHITIEATDFGGVRLGRVLGTLQQQFVSVDDCGRPTYQLSLKDADTLLKVGETTVVPWQLWDDGPYPASQTLASNQQRDGDKITAELLQYINVEDTQPPLLLPPAGFARESASAIDLTTTDFPLGTTKNNVDLADPRPTFSNDAPDLLELDTRYAIEWQARDTSGNVTVASSDNPDQYTQYVTIKTPGTNTAPSAQGNSASAITSQAVEIELSGSDSDILSGRPDPLDFRISDYPDDGLFEAPLLPFFIEDFRLSPVGDQETVEDNAIVRTSPLLHLADQFRLTSDGGRAAFLYSNICNTADADNIAAFSNNIPTSFIYKPGYVHVDDNDVNFVRDYFWQCGAGTANLLPRISKWDAEGNFIDMQDLSALENAATNTTLEEEFSIDRAGWLWFSSITRSSNAGDPQSASFITSTKLYGMNSDFNDLAQYGDVSTNDTLLGNEDHFQDAVVDIDRQIFYELRGFGFRVKPLEIDNPQFDLDSYLNGASALSSYEATYPTGDTFVLDQVAENIVMSSRDGFTSVPGQCMKTTDDIYTYRYTCSAESIVLQPGDEGYCPGAGVTVYRYELREACPLATDIEVDSEGSVYIAQRDYHRILKYGAAVQDEAGDWETGELIGWMGGCTANKRDAEGVFYNACNEELQISRGFQCTDEKCARSHSAGNVDEGEVLFTEFSGADVPGAFDSPASIKMGPQDILYVADTGNSRVQRFGNDGAFAGEAQSTGTGINQGDNGGFMLGNFGKPYSLAVNSSAFYVINRDDENGDNFLHVFKTLPFYDVTDSSAKIKYVSDFNFQGTDSFQFIVDDGIAKSAPAQVDVNVNRAYRPPVGLTAECFSGFTTIAALTDPVPCELDEDTNLVIRLLSKDPDGFLSSGDGGLDQHDFSIIEAPEHGTLTLLATTDNSAVYRFSPSRDYNGTDEFAFNANDGVDDAPEEGLAKLVINPIPDPVDIDLPLNLTAGRGFPLMLNAQFSDVDENFQPELLSVQWGDGTQSIPDSWSNSGNTDENGDEVSPQIDFSPATSPVSATGGRPGTGNGSLLGSHTYSNNDDYDLTLRMMNHDNNGEPNLQTLKTANVEVIDATLVSVAMDSPVDPFDPDVNFNLQLTVTNEVPTTWAGLVAGNVVIQFEKPEGLLIQQLAPSCSGTDTISCSLGNLDPGEFVQLNFVARVSLEFAAVDKVMTLDLDIDNDGPQVEEVNSTVVTLLLADEDEDNVVDVLDAFPLNPLYSVDVDGDGIAEGWELDHGLDDTDSSDAGLDPDNDGANNLQEFLAGTYPLLSEATEPAVEFAIDGGGNDRLGYSLGVGDVNGDGFSDVIAGAPGYGVMQGAIVIYYGGSNGVTASSPITVPGTQELGLNIAVGDLNDDQYDDIAVHSFSGVHLFFGANGALEDPVFVPEPLSSGNFGKGLAIADIDGDDLNDLLIGDSAYPGITSPITRTGAVFVYRAANEYWSDASPVPSKSFRLMHENGTTSDRFFFGDALSVADFDGDGIPDLARQCFPSRPSIRNCCIFCRGSSRLPRY